MTAPVALFTGAWIEIQGKQAGERHLLVALFTGAWIEIISRPVLDEIVSGRSLHGSVDWEYYYEWLSTCGVYMSYLFCISLNSETNRATLN